MEWIEFEGNIDWFTRSPDLCPLDCFLWEYCKTEVCVAQLNNLDDFAEHLTGKFGIQSLYRDFELYVCNLVLIIWNI